jgi:hypothetical protein
VTARDRERGVEWVALPDGRRWPGRVRNGLPEFGFRQAPDGLSTRRQLRDKGLCRGGQEPFARLTWSKAQRFAWLYRDDQAKPKRTATDKQMAAVQKALAARKVCAGCGPVEHYVRTTDRLCGDCHAAGVAPSRTKPATWQQLHEWQADASDTTTSSDTADSDKDEDQRPAAREEADAAVRRAADSARRLAGNANRPDADRVADRDEQLASWRVDDQTADRAADDNYSDRWSQQDRGAA